MTWGSVARDGRTVICRPVHGAVEHHEFVSEEEAIGRVALLTEGLSWLRTPFRDCADVKGPMGAVDCAMFLTRCHVDTGLLAPFDPRPYSPQWHAHQDEEKFTDWLTGSLEAVEVSEPRIGDVGVWQFGRTFSHGGLILGSNAVLHAFAQAGCVTVSAMTDADLSEKRTGGKRPVKFFRLKQWSAE